MKKFILLGLSIFALQSFGLTSISCNNGFQSTPLGTCGSCFTENLYTSQSYGDMTDAFSVSGSGKRLMYFDETGVNWTQVNSNFNLTSSLSTDRTAATGFKRSVLTVPSRMGWFDSVSARKYAVFNAGDTNIRYVESSGGITFQGPLATATPSMRGTPMWRITYDAASHDFTNDTLNPTINHEIQCLFITPRWCGDGIRDTDRNEQCDDGNQANGDGCSSTCQTEVVNNPVCTSLTIAPATLTNAGGTITATCSGTNVSQYKLVFKEGSTVLNTIDYQNSNIGTFTIPANTATASKDYSVQCFVKSATVTDITDSNLCVKTLSVPGTNPNPQCESLTISPTSLTNGGTVNFNCTGINNPTSFEVIFYNPDSSVRQIFTTNSGSIAIPGTPLGSYTAECRVNGQPLISACTKYVSNSTNNVPNPAIRIIKDDNDNHDDTQQVQPGNAAQFTVVVSNPGPEPLENLVITDPYAPECNRSSSETRNMTLNVGNRDARLDPGESFSYICIRPNVGTNTFPNYENRVCVVGQGSTSGISVNSCDTTRITFQSVNNICQYMNVQKNGNRYNVNCGPSGGFKLFALRNKQVVNTFQSPNGIFDITLPNDGEYRLMCIRDGEQSVQPQCQRDINILPEQGVCVLESSVSYGGAPINVNMNCIIPSLAQCSIRVSKNGEPWKTVSDCQANFLFEEKGTYDAVCVVGDADIRECSTRVQIDVPTDVPTGPFLPILLVLALAGAGYVTYRRKIVNSKV